MDKVLLADYERALRSNHPKFIQEVIFRLIQRHDELIDQLADKVYFLTEDYKRKSSHQEKKRILK